MNKLILPLLLVLSSVVCIGQAKKEHYQQFSLSLPFRGNDTYGQVDNNGNRSDYWFLPDGISIKYGIGVFQKKWAALGMHAGINWIGSDKVVTVPVFLNGRLSPKVSDDARIYIHAGYGKSIAVGRGSLMGTYKKIALGLESEEGISIFIEVEDHGFSIIPNHKIWSFSVGLAVITF
jgi:hypothetical protein